MIDLLARGLTTTIDAFVNHVILPVTGVIPLLVRSGLLVLAFAALWVAFAAAAILDPATLEALRRGIEGLPLLVQAGAWLLFLPLMAGLWAWTTPDWPLVVRLVLVAGIAGWNLFTFLPQREPASPAIAS